MLTTLSFLLLLNMTCGLSRAESSFYVSPDGNDNNPGSESQPFKSFERARDAIRSLKASDELTEAVTVYAAGGNYSPVGSPADPVLALDPTTDSGSAAAPITYAAKDASNPPLLLGGVPVPPSLWKPAALPANSTATIPVFQADLGSLGLTASQAGSLSGGGLGQCASGGLMEFFYGDEPMVLARYPNLNYSDPSLPLPSFLHIEAKDSGTQFTASQADRTRLARWVGEMERTNDVWAGGYWTYGWADSYVHLTGIDSASGKVSVNASTPPVYGFKAKARYFGVNLLVELDQEKEYYIDKSTMTLYFAPEGGQAPQLNGYLSLAPQVVGLASSASTGGADPGAAAADAAERRVRAMHFQRDIQAGLTGQEDGPGSALYAARRRDWSDVDEARREASRGSPALQHVTLRGLHVKYGRSGIHFSGANNVTIEDVDASNQGTGAVSIEGSNNTLRSVSSSGCGCAAMHLGGGDEPSLTPGNNLAEGCTADFYARWTRTYNPGLGFSGVGNTYRGNRVASAPHIGMIGSGNDHFFFNNTFDTLVYEVSDSGAWYSGRSWAHRGSRLFNNTFVHCKDREPTYLGSLATHGIYYDDELSAHEAAYNYFFDLYQGVFVGGGRRHSVHDNYFEQVLKPFEMDDRGLTWQKEYCNPKTGHFIQELQALHYQQPPWSTHYPVLVNITQEYPCVPVYNVVNNNVWCPMAGTNFSTVTPEKAASWHSTIENTVQHCRA